VTELATAMQATTTTTNPVFNKRVAGITRGSRSIPRAPGTWDKPPTGQFGEGENLVSRCLSQSRPPMIYPPNALGQAIISWAEGGVLEPLPKAMLQGRSHHLPPWVALLWSS
jgi:hypothetical protein